jgi:hypothetical protein
VRSDSEDPNKRGSRRNQTKPKLKSARRYKKYNDYNKIYCLGPQRYLLAVQALGKHKILFTMPEYNYSEVLLLNIETALANVKKGGGKVVLEEIEL